MSRGVCRFGDEIVRELEVFFWFRLAAVVDFFV